MGGDRRNHGGGDDAGIGCLAVVILCLIAMPLVGLYLILRRDGNGETKAVGWILMIAGVLILAFLMAMGGS